MEFLRVVGSLLLFISAAGSGDGGVASPSRMWTNINNPNSNAAARTAGLTAVTMHNDVLLPGEVVLTFCWVKKAKVRQYMAMGEEYRLTVAVRAAGTEGERVADVKMVVFRGLPDKVIRIEAFLYKPNMKAGTLNLGKEYRLTVAVRAPPNDLCIW